MDSKLRNKKLYMEARQITGASQNDWARLFNLTPLTGIKHGQKGQPIVAANLGEDCSGQLAGFFWIPSVVAEVLLDGFEKAFNQHIW